MTLPLLYILRRAVVTVVVHIETGYCGIGAGVGRGCHKMLEAAELTSMLRVFGQGQIGMLVTHLDHLDELDTI